jgi:chitinase
VWQHIQTVIRKTALFISASLALVLVVASCQASAPAARVPARSVVPEAPRIVGYYFAPTSRRGFLVSSIDAGRLTHVNYAFANIDSAGRAVLGYPCLDVGNCDTNEQNPNSRPGGNFAELRRLKERHPHLRTLISIGGWGWSGRFSDVAATPEARQRFIESALNTFIRDHPGVFDGIDLDWEYPVGGGLPENHVRPDDRQNYTTLVTEFRRALDELGRRDGKRYLLAIATPAGQTHMRNFELVALARTLDFINVMTYDFHTAGKIAHFNAPLGTPTGDPTPGSNVRATVDAYLAAGVPREKLVLGVPFYGYGYGGVSAERDGLFQPAERNGFEQPPTPMQWVGSVRYHQIPQALRSGFKRYWDSAAGVPWLYNSRDRIFITYDDAQSLSLKANLVRERGLGGVMIWELSGDDGTLLPVIHRRLGR